VKEIKWVWGQVQGWTIKRQNVSMNVQITLPWPAMENEPLRGRELQKCPITSMELKFPTEWEKIFQEVLFFLQNPWT
jgi:hypothetical protein